MRVVQLVVLFFLAFGADATKKFWMGRRRGGSVLPPVKTTVEPLAATSGWFTQTLDHFNPQDTRTFQQLYFINEVYYNASAEKKVVFLDIEGEGPASAYWVSAGSWMNYAKEHQALLVELEHRYYGQSTPVENLSVQNLQYLTSQQAIADLASYITFINEMYNLPEDVQWIAFGGSYSGSLAAWLRLEYPYLVQGAMSASGPILAKVDFHEYLGVVANSLDYFSPGCSSYVLESFEAVQAAVFQDEASQQMITEAFNLCTPVQDSVNNPKDIGNLMEALTDSMFSGTVQYNLINGGGITINTVCDIMVDETKTDPIQRLVDVYALFSDEECLDYNYDAMVELYRNESLDGEAATSGWRPWLYQTCTEFGYFQTSSHEPQIFGDTFPVSFFTDLCVDLFGEEFNADYVNGAINRTNVIFGGLDIDVSNVVFVHGSIDPWHALGITETRDLKAPAIYIEGTAHCANMYDPLPTDPPGLSLAIEEVGRLITSWLES